jgi:predicted metal-dependent hydrolase
MNISGIRIIRSLYHTRSHKLYLANKEAARILVHERVRHFNLHYKLPIGKIAIRNQKSRWGSCSKKGNLNFNYKLVFLEPELRDYVIVHEICHVKEFNHAKAFWDLVGETVPNWRELRKKLRKLH